MKQTLNIPHQLHYSQYGHSSIKRLKYLNQRISAQTSRTSEQSADHELLLPHDKLAEQAVLGAIIIHNTVILQILDILTSDDFFSPAHQLIFAVMQEMASQEPPIPIDELTLLSRLESKKQLDLTGGVDYLNELSQKTPVEIGRAHV